MEELTPVIYDEFVCLEWEIFCPSAGVNRHYKCTFLNPFSVEDRLCNFSSTCDDNVRISDCSFCCRLIDNIQVCPFFHILCEGFNHLRIHIKYFYCVQCRNCFLEICCVNSSLDSCSDDCEYFCILRSKPFCSCCRYSTGSDSCCPCAVKNCSRESLFIVVQNCKTCDSRKSLCCVCRESAYPFDSGCMNPWQVSRHCVEEGNRVWVDCWFRRVHIETFGVLCEHFLNNFDYCLKAYIH